jgi:hypothetical protein
MPRTDILPQIEDLNPAEPAYLTGRPAPRLPFRLCIRLCMTQ